VASLQEMKASHETMVLQLQDKTREHRDMSLEVGSLRRTCEELCIRLTAALESQRQSLPLAQLTDLVLPFTARRPLKQPPPCSASRGSEYLAHARRLESPPNQ
jgi:hypothetical protein